ncbi:MAG: signal transduction histidine kinase [Candidatus Azotimanducaceae bacterium]|jgi:signal transduction histidine kinase
MSNSTNTSRPTILIADDESTTRLMMQAMLDENGFEVTTAADGKEALELFHKKPSDGVILDLDMPRMGGLEVCRNIRLEKAWEFVPLIISTASDDLRSIDEAFNAGATDFLTKPHNWGLLVRRVRYILKASTAMEKIRRSEQLKTEFMHNISHELRTPLNGVLGMVELLKTTDLSDEQKEYCSIVNQSGKALLSIIGDTLDYSKLVSGSIQYETREFCLDDLVQESCDMVYHIALSKKLPLVVNIHSSCPTFIKADPLRLKQVLGNLLSNAVKFTNTGFVRLDVVLDDVLDDVPGGQSTLKFTVIDTGIGISKSAEEIIFEPFQQADGSTTRQFGGTGLGLPIARSLVKDMGGELTLRQRPMNAGAAFQVRLPFASSEKNNELQKNLKLNVFWPDSQLDQGIDKRDLLHSVTNQFTFLNKEQALANPPQLVVFNDFTQIEHLQEPSPLISTHFVHCQTIENTQSNPGYPNYTRILGPLLRNRLQQILSTKVESSGSIEQLKVRENLSILVAEDNFINQKIIKNMLTNLGADCTVVGDGQAALDYAGQSDWDIIFMDCAMPRLDGYEATRRIRLLEATAASASQGRKFAVIVALTAYALKSDIEVCLAAGMDDHISKPCNPQNLYEMVEKYFPRT